MKSILYSIINTVVFIVLSLGLVACSSDNDRLEKTASLKDNTSAAQWFSQGREAVLKRKKILLSRESRNQKAKNIIFVLGDGMGVSTLTAARIFVGQQQSLLGEEYALSFEEFPHTALIKTYNVDLQTPDSAGTMTALMTGVKTDEGIISLPASVIRGDCGSISPQDTTLPTLLDIAKAKGKSTAVVTTARITHATPATTYAHSVDRNWESDDAIPQVAKDLGCKDIAAQLVADKGRSVDMILGGGRRHFLPKDEGGKRLDGNNLIAQWQNQGGRYVDSLADLQQLMSQEKSEQEPFSVEVSKKAPPVLGLFAKSHLSYAYQRPEQQPSLQQMTSAALNQLQKNDQGYALIIEAGRIDHGHHDGMAYKALTETQELHDTVAWLLTQVDLAETLIVVTADHSHTLTLSGYATRGNPILGHVVGNDAEGYPEQMPVKDTQGNAYTSLSYRDGPGADAHQGKQDKQVVHSDHLHDPNYQQIALVPMDYETHGGEDVALYAIGPQSQLFSGTLEQHWVFHALKYAM